MKVFFLLLIISINALASNTLRCEYDNFNKQLEFSLNDFEQDYFKKEFQVKEKIFKIYVKNLKEPNEVDDFLEISDANYKMTYSLSCKIHKPMLAKNY